MSNKFKFWFLIGGSAFMAIAGIGGSITGWFCAPLFFCTAMIIDAMPTPKAERD